MNKFIIIVVLFISAFGCGYLAQGPGLNDKCVISCTHPYVFESFTEASYEQHTWTYVDEKNETKYVTGQCRVVSGPSCKIVKS